MPEPPQDNAAEQAVVGSLMLSKTAIGLVVEIVRGEDFYRPAHETIFNVIVDLYGKGGPTDPIAVADELSRRGEINRIGGAPYVHTLTEAVPGITGDATYWAEIVRDKAVLRRLAAAGEQITQYALAGSDDVSSIVDRAQATILDAMPRSVSADYAVVGDMFTEAMDQIEETANRGSALPERAVPTGFLDLDDLLAGFQSGQMVTVAGRPAMGKSTLALDFMRACSLRNGLASCMFSLEMTRQEIVTRLLSAEAKVGLANIRNGRLNDSDWAKIALQYEPITKAPLFIDDSPNLTMAEIRAKARRLVSAHDLRLIVIDYLQLMSSGQKVESRQVEVSEFSRQIKLLAKELRIPVIAVSQLNRGPEQRSSKRPLMSDLRESGSIEQDSDIVMLLHREDAYELESSRPGEADIIVAKHRNGATRDIAVAAQLHYSRFTDLAHV